MISSRVVEAITPLELSRASALFGVLKQVRVQLKTSDEYSLDKAFESHVHSVLEKLDQRLVSIDDTAIQKVEIIMAKHGKQLDHKFSYVTLALDGCGMLYLCTIKASIHSMQCCL